MGIFLELDLVGTGKGGAPCGTSWVLALGSLGLVCLCLFIDVGSCTGAGFRSSCCFDGLTCKGVGDEALGWTALDDLAYEFPVSFTAGAPG